MGHLLRDREHGISALGPSSDLWRNRLLRDRISIYLLDVSRLLIDFLLSWERTNHLPSPTLSFPNCCSIHRFPCSSYRLRKTPSRVLSVIYPRTVSTTWPSVFEGCPSVWMHGAHNGCESRGTASSARIKCPPTFFIELPIDISTGG